MRYTEAREIIAEAAMALQDILNEDIFDLESAKASRRKVNAAEKRSYDISSRSPNFAARRKAARNAYEKELKRHRKMGSSDTMYHHDPKTGGFRKGESLPKGSAKAAALDAERVRGTKVSPKHKKALVKAAKKHGGIVASSRKEHDGPALHSDALVTGKPRKTESGKRSKRVAAPNQYVKWRRDNDPTYNY